MKAKISVKVRYAKGDSMIFELGGSSYTAHVDWSKYQDREYDILIEDGKEPKLIEYFADDKSNSAA